MICPPFSPFSPFSLESNAFLGVGYRAEDFVVALENEELGAGESR